STGIDNRDGVLKLGCNVKQIANSIVHRTMRSNWSTEIDVSSDFASGNIDDQHFVAIDPGLTQSNVAVDRQVRGTAVRRYRYLMTVTHGVAFRYGRCLLGRNRIDDTDVSVSLIYSQQNWFGNRLGLAASHHGETDARQQEMKCCQFSQDR